MKTFHAFLNHYATPFHTPLFSGKPGRGSWRYRAEAAVVLVILPVALPLACAGFYVASVASSVSGFMLRFKKKAVREKFTELAFAVTLIPCVLPFTVLYAFSGWPLAFSFLKPCFLPPGSQGLKPC